MGDVCQHGRSGPCVQCDPWCPRDLSPERAAELQALYESAGTTARARSVADSLREFCETVHRATGEDGVVGVTVTPRVFDALAKASGLGAIAASAREMSFGNVLVRRAVPTVVTYRL